MSNKHEICLQKKIGVCTGCDVLKLVITRARWAEESLANAAKVIGQEYCPSGVKPQTDKLQNMHASSGMGQRREENLIFDRKKTKRGIKKHHGKY